MANLFYSSLFFAICIYGIQSDPVDPIPKFRVVTIATPPFLTAYDRVHNDTYEGYVIDLLNELRHYFVFDYEIHLSKSGYGILQENGSWTGMMSELLNNEADLAVADFTITEDRLKVIDFSFPYITTGIGILARRPPYFLSNHNVTVEAVENGEVYRPMVFYPVSSVNDLPNQDIVEYGSINGGSTYSFFKTSKNPVFKKIGEHLQQNVDSLPQTTEEAFHRVINGSGKYVFFMEGAAIEYFMGTTCTVHQMGNLINRRSYAIGMRKNFEYKSAINSALLRLSETNALQRLRNKWLPHPTLCHKALDRVYMRNALQLLHTEVKQ